MPRLLITNDDGIDSPGLAAAEQALEGLGELWVVAPESQRSGYGRAVSSHKPIRFEEINPRRYSISGTPADAVIIARESLMPSIDLVVTGMNAGANIGINTMLWSGTCGAAFEAAGFGSPAIAVSLELKEVTMSTDMDPAQIETAKKVLRSLAEKILTNSLPRDIDMLNVNVPMNPKPGIVVAKLGRHYLRADLKKKKDKLGEYYFLSAKVEPDQVPDTDAYALHHGDKTVITPISLNALTTDIQSVKKFLEDLI